MSVFDHECPDQSVLANKLVRDLRAGNPDISTNAELEALCREWQEILRLQDWNVRIRFERYYNMPRGHQGTNTNNTSKKTALIAILEPGDFDSSEWTQDVEQTLVHELLHLHTAPFTDVAPPSYPLMLEEQAIESLARALVGLRRRCR